MNRDAFFYGVWLQWKLDIRSKTLLITCYLVPLLFFVVMGGIFTAITPEAKDTLIPSMTVFGVTMGALIGLPPSLVEIYGSDIRKVYQANGVPVYLGAVLSYLSAYLHLLLMSLILYCLAPLIFHATLPSSPALYFAGLAVVIGVSLSVAGVIGLAVKDQAKTSMYSILIFLPSIMLSGLMFPVSLLPKGFEEVGKLFPAYWGYRLVGENGWTLGNLWPLFVLFAAALVCVFLLKRVRE